MRGGFTAGDGDRSSGYVPVERDEVRASHWKGHGWLQRKLQLSHHKMDVCSRKFHTLQSLNHSLSCMRKPNDRPGSCCVIGDTGWFSILFAGEYKV